MANEEEKLSGFIPDFFAELITRVAPGLVFIGLFLYSSGSKLKGGSLTLGSSVFMLVIAWSIGVALDLGGFYAGTAILGGYKKFRKKGRKDGDKGPKDGDLDDGLQKCVRRAGLWERGALLKEVALKIFLRNMGTIFFVVFVTCLVMCFPSKLSCWLPVLARDHVFYLFASLILWALFLFCWCFHYRALERNVEQFKRLHHE